MRLAVIGLGRMGANISLRLMRAGHEIVGFDRNPDNVAALVEEGASGASSLEDASAKLAAPRIFWVMLPAGHATEETVASLRELAEPGDIIIDGGNSFFKDDVRRSKECAAKGVHYIDVGTSGGIWGLDCGFCLMIGGDPTVVEQLDPIFNTLAPGRGTIVSTRPEPAATIAPRAAIFMPGLRAPAISSRWSTTASNMASCRPMPRASTFFAGGCPTSCRKKRGSR